MTSRSTKAVRSQEGWGLMLTLDTKPSSSATTELLDYISSQTNTINIRTRRAKMAAKERVGVPQPLSRPRKIQNSGEKFLN